MDFEEIKKIAERDGGKFIIIENGKPVLVVVGFEEYKKKLEKKEEPEKKQLPETLQKDELQIEDLPF